MARDEFGLTPRQRKFADYYIETGNSSEAARRAGYSPKTAHRAGIQNMQIRPIKAYIAMRMKPDEERRIADADEVLQYLSDVMRGLVKDQFGLDASLQDRTKAAQELMKRYAVADMRQQSTMARLDSLFVEFRAALESPAAQQPTAAPEPSAGAESPTQDPEPSPDPTA